jgi:hypothetical protein
LDAPVRGHGHLQALLQAEWKRQRGSLLAAGLSLVADGLAVYSESQ